MTRYGIVVDLNRCVRSRTCYVVCKEEHGIIAHPRDDEHPCEHYRLRYVEWEHGNYPTTKRAFIPTLCMMCKEPLCAKSCGVGAITQRNDGIVIIDKDRCNGCGVCIAACPYGAIYIDPSGKADKCDFCVDRLDAGLLPRCVEECPSKALISGNLDDPESKVFKLVASGEAKPLLIKDVKNTQVFYIPSAKEPDWRRLEHNGDFLKALDKRKRDL